MNNDTFDKIIEHSPELRGLPDSIYQLNQAMRNKSVTMSEIADIVSSDPVLSARILKSVNSPFYGFPSKIDTVAYAVSILGIDSIHYLAISNAVVSKFSHNPNTLISSDDFWRHSFSTAVIAQKLAQTCNHKNSDRIFTAGLLHELGGLLLAIAIPGEYKKVISAANSEKTNLHMAEKKILGFTHADISAQLLRRWELPASVYETIQYMYTPDATEAWQTDSAIINIADSVASATFPSVRLANMEFSIPRTTWKLSGIHPQQLNNVLDELDQLVETAMRGMYFETAA